MSKNYYSEINLHIVWHTKESLPLLIPEINADHLGLVEVQRKKRGYGKGFIVTNPNCAVASIAPPLAALDRKFGIESASCD